MKRAKGLFSGVFLTIFAVLLVTGCEITTSTEECGDGRCRGDESCSTCPEDCGVCAECGNGTCESSESCSTCPADCGACPTCGDGTCDASESCSTCPADCGVCPTCGDGTCDATETCETCPADCGPCVGCGDGICEGTETCETCPEDCGVCPSGARVSFAWYIHGVQGGVDVGWGSGVAQEVCELVQTLTEIPAMPVVQLWLEETGDDVADTRVDFTCTAGMGMTDAFWEDGDTIKYAFSLVDGDGNLLSQSTVWETVTLADGDNDLGETNFYIGEYGPLGVDISWGDTSLNFGDCAFPEPDVNTMGYLLCWGPLSGDTCPTGYLYDEVDIDISPIDCRTELDWDITDFGTYVLVIDGEDALGTTLWGVECRDLVVDEMEPESNNFDCLVILTTTP